MTGSISQKTQEKKQKKAKQTRTSYCLLRTPEAHKGLMSQFVKALMSSTLGYNFALNFFINPPVDLVIITRRTGVTETPAFDTQEGPVKRHVTSAPSREWNITTERSTLDKMSYLGTFLSGGWWQVVWNTRGHESQQINSPSSPHSSQ